MTESIITDSIGAETALRDPGGRQNVEIEGHARLPIRFKALYASGDMVDGTVAYAVGAYLFYYLTVVCGLSGTLAGLALAITLAVDAIADPLIGFVSDNTRSRLGRRHPYMFLSALPAAVSLGLIFSVPAGLTGGALFAYVMAALLVLRVAMSAFTLPYAALGAELTANYTERSTVVAYRSAFNIFANFVTMSLALRVFLKDAHGHLDLLNRAAYAPFAWCVAGLTLAGGLISAFGTLPLRGRLRAVPANASASPLRMLAELKDVARNRSFVALFICILLFWAAQGTIGILNLHVVKYFWRLPGGVIQTLPLFSLGGLATGIPIAGLVLQRAEKRVVSILGPGDPLRVPHRLASPFRIPAGVLLTRQRHGGTLALWSILAVAEVLKNWAVTCVAISFWSMLADAADEHEFLFRQRREGLFFAGPRRSRPRRPWRSALWSRASPSTASASRAISPGWAMRISRPTSRATLA